MTHQKSLKFQNVYLSHLCGSVFTTSGHLTPLWMRHVTPVVSFRNMVACLSVSMDGTLLLSGSHDETVRVWDIQSRQTIRCLAHKGKGVKPGITAVRVGAEEKVQFVAPPHLLQGTHSTSCMCVQAQWRTPSSQQLQPTCFCLTVGPLSHCHASAAT